MAGRQAKVISPAQLESMLNHVRGRRDGLRSKVIILLSVTRVFLPATAKR